MSTNGLRYPPRGQRTIADIGTLLRNDDGCMPGNRVALMIGAGVDKGLSNRPLWADLIRKLSGEAIEERSRDALARTSMQWPLEAAEALKTTVGSAAFDQSLRNFVGAATPAPPEHWISGIGELVRNGLQVVVSLNYTPDFQSTLQGIFPHLKIRTFDRTHLSALRQGEIFSPADGALHLIHLHGRVDAHSSRGVEVVLDRRSYDVSLGSHYYVGFLRRLFQDYTVITLGMSWNDPALRFVVSQVQFEYPISGRAHAAILPQSESVGDWWLDRALLTSYNVRSIFYPNINEHRVEHGDEHREAPELLRSIAQQRPAISLEQPIDIILPEVADKLDEWGDYESASQSDWMAQHWESLMQALRRQTRDDLTPTRWAALARIERHLRHFLWFYLPHEIRAEVRGEIWNRIAALYSTLSLDERNALWQPPRLERVVGVGTGVGRADYTQRGIFEFALGAYEVQYLHGSTAIPVERVNWRLALERIAESSPLTILGRRVRLARNLWSRRPGNEELEKLRLAAVACKWEGIEAKLALDVLQVDFSKAKAVTKQPIARAWPDAVRERILGLAEDARMVSRAAGCFRREVGSVIIASFAQPGHAAEANLLAMRERLLESSGRRYEISMLWWVYAALIAVDYDGYRATKEEPYTDDRALQYLVHRCSDFNPDPSTAAHAILENSLPHWAKFHEPAAVHLSQMIRLGLQSVHE